MVDESGGEKRYKTARALEMALKEAARKSGRDVSRAMADFWHGSRLSACLSRELRMGHMGEGRPFSVPDSWKGPFAPTYRKLAKECGLPIEFHKVDAAEQMVARCVDAALDGGSKGKRWDAESLSWRDE